jgi:hypothetical protein
MNDTSKIEKFAASDLVNLRTELQQCGIDSWQAVEVLRAFLAGRGYGVSTQGARDSVVRLEGTGCNLDCIQRELESVAFVM